MSLARLAALAGVAVVAGCRSGNHSVTHTAPTVTSRAVVGPVPRVTTRIAIPAGTGHLAAMAGRRGLVLRDRPHGRVIAHLLPETAYGSPTVVWAAAQRGRWLGVVAASLPDGHLGWIDIDHDRPRMWRSPYSIVASLSQRSLVLERGRHVVRRFPVTIGGADTPTPIGHFEVTDKLLPNRQSGYGCCILALSGHQSHFRPGWAGGDRIAIHGSPDQLVGAAASAGCLRARDSDLRYLLKRVPLGTPVWIRA